MAAMAVIVLVNIVTEDKKHSICLAENQRNNNINREALQLS